MCCTSEGKAVNWPTGAGGKGRHKNPCLVISGSSRPTLSSLYALPILESQCTAVFAKMKDLRALRNRCRGQEKGRDYSRIHSVMFSTARPHRHRCFNRCFNLTSLSLYKPSVMPPPPPLPPLPLPPPPPPAPRALPVPTALAAGTIRSIPRTVRISYSVEFYVHYSLNSSFLQVTMRCSTVPERPWPRPKRREGAHRDVRFPVLKKIPPLSFSFYVEMSEKSVSIHEVDTVSVRASKLWETKHIEHVCEGGKDSGLDVAAVLEDRDLEAVQPDEREINETRRSVRKVDMRLLPALATIYPQLNWRQTPLSRVSPLSRGYSFALRIAGMDEDVQLSAGNRYTLITMIFFVPYAIFHFQPTYSYLVVAWGVVSIGIGFNTSWTQNIDLGICLTLPAEQYRCMQLRLLPSNHSEVLAFPPYVAAAPWIFFTAWVADRYRKRGLILIFNCLAATMGVAMMGFTYSDPAARYAGVFFGVCGGNSNVPTILSYMHNNIVGQMKRSVASALNIGGGAIGGIVASNIFRQQDAPRYVPAMGIAIATQAVSILHVFKISGYMRGLIIEGQNGFRHTL
ncbi:uncharacterized protein MYCFIDRAFT_207030 [Pseudocercospora fijiensis CIRAD86]|uniref:Major facilitator superfamily (MFS) profile domain-containing protein n=1 Tax=Pseudocercospora fijiensis (strain CIRAD86) TaxID=383855 RepID=M2ZB31_PSEFD|nr:uncharacterized protein MYCFIDRAFT_207030 [Pseudocercospora fijiensis CIRAD86]EME87065.1 hypothetical protein MYCFIDRAFT_207030 [Pseudocercospora fijiensis CIRAD86]